eukprot:1158004-Pelagomonas_calceolata.AAC.10
MSAPVPLQHPQCFSQCCVTALQCAVHAQSTHTAHRAMLKAALIGTSMVFFLCLPCFSQSELRGGWVIRSVHQGGPLSLLDLGSAERVGAHADDVECHTYLKCVCLPYQMQHSQDDEETLAAEEAMAAKEQEAGGRREMDELDEEANLPLEELLARCVWPGTSFRSVQHKRCVWMCVISWIRRLPICLSRSCSLGMWPSDMWKGAHPALFFHIPCAGGDA